jgi:hypothetical protein
MQTLPDYHLDALFRAGLDEEAETLASTAASRSQMLERVGRVLARQRTRRQHMTLLLAAALTTLTAATIVLGGSRISPPVTPEPSSESSATEEPFSAEPEPSLGTELGEGPVVLWVPRLGGPPVTVRIAAPGWSFDPGGRQLIKDGYLSRPGGAYLHGWWTTRGVSIPEDPCQWQSTMPETPATTIDEIAAALASQASRDASAPVDVTVDGRPGKSFTLHVSDDFAWASGGFTDCDQGTVCSGSADVEAGCMHTLYRPGQISEMWIVEVDDQILFMEAAYYPETPAEHVEELKAILRSMSVASTPTTSPLPSLAPGSETANDWPDTTENQAGVYSWDGSYCGMSCNSGFMHNGYGSNDLEIRIVVLDEGVVSYDAAEATIVAGHDGIYRRISPLREEWIVDIEGTVIAIHLTVRSGVSETDSAEAHAIIDSMRTEAADNDLGFRLIFTLTTDDWDSG